jgi:hypothetical protein
MVLPLVVELSVEGVSAAELGSLSLVKSDRPDRIRRATVRGAIAGGIDDPFMLKVPLTPIVCKSHCTDVGALKGGGGVH